MRLHMESSSCCSAAMAFGDPPSVRFTTAIAVAKEAAGVDESARRGVDV